jgi:hypothetical protein
MGQGLDNQNVHDGCIGAKRMMKKVRDLLHKKYYMNL